MTALPPVSRGVRPLRRLLREREHDVRTLDLVGFQGWLEHHLSRWHADPVFLQRSAIRDLRRANPRIAELERELRRAERSERAETHFPRLMEVERELVDAGKAVTGLTAAASEAGAERREELRRKLAVFEERRRDLAAERDAATRASPGRQARLRLEAELAEARTEAGLDRAEQRLAELLAAQGRRSGRGGTSFEETTAAVAMEHIVPELAPGRAATERIRPLQGVTLGAARTEIDLLVVRLPHKAGEPCEVLAMVEAKRNPNDLAHGFVRRQENLAWLTGDTGGYPAEAYRTRSFPSGHFDRPAEHRQDGEAVTLGPGSFRLFRRDPDGLFITRLYLVTRGGSLWGLSGAALARIGHRAATDPAWNPDDFGYLRQLHQWCLSLAGAWEAPDVVRRYAAAGRRARQLLVLGP